MNIYSMQIQDAFRAFRVKPWGRNYGAAFLTSHRTLWAERAEATARGGSMLRTPGRPDAKPNVVWAGYHRAESVAARTHLKRPDRFWGRTPAVFGWSLPG